MLLQDESVPYESAPYRLRRYKTLRLNAELLIAMFVEMQQGRRYYTAKGLPEDAQVVGIGLDSTVPNTYTVLLESEEFRDVPKGAIPEEIQIIITANEFQREPAMPR